MSASPQTWQGEYAQALHRHLGEGAGESSLQRAYELGRSALAAECGVVELAVCHAHALAEWLDANAEVDPRQRLGSAAAAFLAEALAPYELMRRRWHEAGAWLRHLQEYSDSEARRIAGALHDGAAQLLAAVHLQLDLLAAGLPPAAQAEIQQSRQLLDQIEAQLRDLSHELRPALLDEFGLEAALRALADTIWHRYGLRVHIHPGSEIRYSHALEIGVFRILQEALTNAAKHAGAASATVELQHGPGVLAARVSDEGCGFDPRSVPAVSGRSGIGLDRMRARALALGGLVEIHSSPGRGTRVEVSLPLGT